MMIDPRLPTFPPCFKCGLLAVLGKGVEARLVDLIDFPHWEGSTGRLTTASIFKEKENATFPKSVPDPRFPKRLFGHGETG
jgi:hypothetical protein